MSASKTGRTIDVYGTRLAEVDQLLGSHDLIEVEGVWYYTHDFGGVIVGSRTATGVDYGGNELHGTRTAPTSTMGLAAPLRGLPCRIQYGEPEICERQD